MEIRRDADEYTVYLLDDGTLDTVIGVTCPDGTTTEVRFSGEYAAEHRDDNGAMTNNGFQILAEEAIDSLEV